ncbi:MAG TPA: M48 family metalloprotease [Stellaceae bacterium]|nr:M48 family metalloprotease [Stellaceae bacterium]
MRRLGGLVLAGFAAMAGTARADENPVAAIYTASEVEPLRARYEKGWLGNYDRVFVPSFTAEERQRLGRVRFEFAMIDPPNEPFAFHSIGDRVFASAQSLKFLDDLSTATAWLSLNGYTNQTVTDYALMLRYWRRSHRGEAPPKPLEALCIPADALSNPRVEERANRIFDDAVIFILLHELGHVRWGHPGNAAVAPERSRANEEAADAFALDVLSRANVAPLGLAMVFMVMANLWENRADFPSEAEYQRAANARTHPLSPARIQSLATHIAAAGRGFNGESRITAMGVSLEISQVALLLADPGLQGIEARIGRTVEADDLAPRHRGQQLARSCRAAAPTGLPFDGVFHGKLHAGKTDFEADAVLTQAGDRVVGSYSFGAGFARVTGSVLGPRLGYEWSLPPDKGRGAATLRGDSVEGTWGMGTADSGVGTMSFDRVR